MSEKIKNILSQENFSKEDLLELMKIDNSEDLDLLFKKAYEIKMLGERFTIVDLLR